MQRAAPSTSTLTAQPPPTVSPTKVPSFSSHMARIRAENRLLMVPGELGPLGMPMAWMRILCRPWRSTGLYLRTADSAASMDGPVKSSPITYTLIFLSADHQPCTASPMPSTGLELLYAFQLTIAETILARCAAVSCSHWPLVLGNIGF